MTTVNMADKLSHSDRLQLLAIVSMFVAGNEGVAPDEPFPVDQALHEYYPLIASSAVQVAARTIAQCSITEIKTQVLPRLAQEIAAEV